MLKSQRHILPVSMSQHCQYVGTKGKKEINPCEWTGGYDHDSDMTILISVRKLTYRCLIIRNMGIFFNY